MRSAYVLELAATLREFPAFKIASKRDSWFMRLLSWLLFFNPEFLRSYTTTIGSRMWTPLGWDTYTSSTRAIIIRHERVHLRQQRRLGMVRYALQYLCWPLPLLWSAGRAALEREAYAESLRAHAEYHGHAILTSPELKARITEHFLSAAYGWMWPRRHAVDAWYEATVALILEESA